MRACRTSQKSAILPASRQVPHFQRLAGKIGTWAKGGPAGSRPPGKLDRRNRAKRLNRNNLPVCRTPFGKFGRLFLGHSLPPPAHS